MVAGGRWVEVEVESRILVDVGGRWVEVEMESRMPEAGGRSVELVDAGCR